MEAQAGVRVWLWVGVWEGGGWGRGCVLWRGGAYNDVHPSVVVGWVVWGCGVVVFWCCGYYYQ